MHNNNNRLVNRKKYNINPSARRSAAAGDRRWRTAPMYNALLYYGLIPTIVFSIFIFRISFRNDFLAGAGRDNKT